MNPRLVYDVGSNNGDDAAYYLYRGFDVVAVEANPLRADELRNRFSREIREGRLTLLPVGIAPDAGVHSFWINKENDKLSSLDRSLGGRHAAGCEEIRIHCMQFQTILNAYGMPYYLKVDIEGYDDLCVSALDPSDLPVYVSAEAGRFPGVAARLYALGYRRFKLINQSTFTDSLPIFPSDIPARLVRKACTKAPSFARLVRRLPNGFRFKRHDFDSFITRFDYAFSEGCSGPFGEETYGSWLPYQQLLARMERVERAYTKGGLPPYKAWYGHDVHAAAEGAHWDA
jgi:FkbM family methyltransferase